MTKPTVYLIRHGEKPSKQADGHESPGLSSRGVQRAQALARVFGSKSSYNIQYIMAQRPKGDGRQGRPSQTVEPLAKSLGLVPNFQLDRDDIRGVCQAVHDFKGPGNILICWEHHRLTQIAEALGVAHPPEYPSERYDAIWTIEYPYHRFSPVTSECCPGLD